MKTIKSTMIAITLATLFTASQVAMAEHQDSSGYDLLLNNQSSQMVTPHSEASTLNGNLEDSATYGALYNSIASPVAGSDNGHGVHEHEYAAVLKSPQEGTSHELVGDTFYFDTSQ